MTRVLQLSIVLFMIANVGFSQECDSDEHICKQLTLEIMRKCTCGVLPQSTCAILLEELREQECPPREEEMEVGVNNEYWPLTDGSLDGFNISVHYDVDDKTVFARVVKIDGGKPEIAVADIDLSVNTIEIYFTSDKNSKFKFRSYPGNEVGKYGTKSVTISDPKTGLDVKIIPKLSDGSGPGIVGGNDARDLKVDDGVAAPLAFDSFPFNRKILVHYEKASKSLKFAGSKVVSIRKGKVDPTKEGKICWDRNMDKCF